MRGVRRGLSRASTISAHSDRDCFEFASHKVKKHCKRNNIGLESGDAGGLRLRRNQISGGNATTRKSKSVGLMFSQSLFFSLWLSAGGALAQPIVTPVSADSDAPVFITREWSTGPAGQEVKSLFAKQGKLVEITRDQSDRLKKMEVTNGLVIAFKYDSDLTRDPAEIKIGHRKWVDVRGAKRKSACASSLGTHSEISGEDDPAASQLEKGQKDSQANNQSISGQVTLKYSHDDPITQQDLIDLSYILNALTYAQFEDFNARQRCVDRCNDAFTVGSLICLAVGFFGTPVAGGACELSMGVHWAACRIGCSTL